MSRFEGKISSEGELPVEAGEILAALRRDSLVSPERRQDAVRRYLSGSDGWREASSLLDGAFAPNGDGQKPEGNE